MSARPRRSNFSLCPTNRRSGVSRGDEVRNFVPVAALAVAVVAVIEPSSRSDLVLMAIPVLRSWRWTLPARRAACRRSRSPCSYRSWSCSAPVPTSRSCSRPRSLRSWSRWWSDSFAERGGARAARGRVAGRGQRDRDTRPHLGRHLDPRNRRSRGGSLARSCTRRGWRRNSRRRDASWRDQAMLEERRRIARDVHDFVGHGLAAVMLQVTSARHVLRRDPAAAEEALRSAEDVGRAQHERAAADGRVAAQRRRDRQSLPPVPPASEIPALVDERARRRSSG